MANYMTYRLDHVTHIYVHTHTRMCHRMDNYSFNKNSLQQLLGPRACATCFRRVPLGSPLTETWTSDQNLKLKKNDFRLN